MIKVCMRIYTIINQSLRSPNAAHGWHWISTLRLICGYFQVYLFKCRLLCVSAVNWVLHSVLIDCLLLQTNAHCTLLFQPVGCCDFRALNAIKPWNIHSGFDFCSLSLWYLLNFIACVSNVVHMYAHAIIWVVCKRFLRLISKRRCSVPAKRSLKIQG